MTTASRRPAAAAAVVLAAVLGVGACSSGGQSTGAGTAAPSTSAPAPSTPPPSSSGSAGSISPSGSAGSGPGAPDQSQRAAQQSRQAAKQRRKQAARHRRQQSRHRQQVQERKRLIAACTDDTKTLNTSVSTYNRAVSSGAEDQMSYAAAILRDAAEKVDHNAERAKNHRLSRLSDKVVHELGVMASLIEQGEDVPGATSDSLTEHSTALRSFCSDTI